MRTWQDKEKDDSLISDIGDKILADPFIKSKLAEGLRRMMLDYYASRTDAISLRNWFCQLYGLHASDFDNVYIYELQQLGCEILGRESEAKGL